MPIITDKTPWLTRPLRCHSMAAISPVYNQCKKSPLFEKKQFKNQSVFCPDFISKPCPFLSFPQKSTRFSHNILQTNALRPILHASQPVTDAPQSSRNPLIYKILNRFPDAVNGKVKKLMYFFIRFCIAFSMLFSPFTLYYPH